MVPSHPHQPDLLPPREEVQPKLRLLTSAHHALGELKGRMIIEDVINPQLVVAPLLTKEAVSSARIEGTRTTVEEVLRYEAQAEKEEDSDILEVLNYRKAIYESVNFLQEKPLGEHLIRKLHQILLSSVRGKERNPGNYRRVAVHLGRPGSIWEDAEYIPPRPDEIPGLMKNWVEFVYLEEVDPLIAVGMGHYQFEAIHPFMDGNGRIGRLLIPLSLYQKEVLSYPYLYISEFFEKNRSEYYDALRSVDRQQDWTNWLNFFLKGVTETAQQIQGKVLQIYRLYSEMKEILVEMNSQYAQLFLDTLFEQPIISNKEILKRLNQPSTQTVYNLIEKFEHQKIIREITGKKRNKVYAFDRLLEVIK